MVSNDKVVGGHSGSLFESSACIENFLGIGWGVQILSEKALYFTHKPDKKLVIMEVSGFFTFSKCYGLKKKSTQKICQFNIKHNFKPH